MADPIFGKEGTVEEPFNGLQSFKREDLVNLHTVSDRPAWHMALSKTDGGDERRVTLF
jgi:hypothetical protein